MLSVLLRMQMPSAIIYMALSEMVKPSSRRLMRNQECTVSGKHTKCLRDGMKVQGCDVC